MIGEGAAVDGWWMVVALARVAPALLIALGGARLGVGRVATIAIAAVIALAIAGVGGPLLEPAVVRVAEGGLSLRVAILAREVGIGVALGVVALVPIAAAELAGRWIATVAGGVDDDGGVWATAATLLAAMVFFALGGHLALIEALGASYRALPPGAGTSLAAGSVLAAGATLVAEAVALAAPLLGAVMVSALVIGGIERAAELAAGALPVEALRRAAATVALAAMVFALAYAVAALTRGLPVALAAATAP